MSSGYGTSAGSIHAATATAANGLTSLTFGATLDRAHSLRSRLHDLANQAEQIARQLIGALPADKDPQTGKGAQELRPVEPHLMEMHSTFDASDREFGRLNAALNKLAAASDVDRL